MLRKTMFAAAAVMCACGSAAAAEYAYIIDHGTPGVISSESKMARIVLVGTGDCSNIPYEVITDGVKSLSGSMDLTKPLSLPLDLTTVTLSCSTFGVKAVINRKKESLF